MTDGFITLCEPGVGSLIIRHSEITAIEPALPGFARIYVSNGSVFVVEGDPASLRRWLAKIQAGNL